MISEEAELELSITV